MQPNGRPAPDAEATANGIDQEPLPLNDAEADAEILRLAGLSTLSYGRERKSAADRLGLSLQWLDKMVKEKKAEIVAQAAGNGEVDNRGQGRPINLPEPKPWPHAVNGAELLSAITKSVLRYMVMEPGAAECVALWAVTATSLAGIAG